MYVNNKGFTLVELLATIVLIAILGGIATVSVIGVINTSKNKGEKIFVDKIETAIETYLSLNSSSFSKKPDGLTGKFFKDTGRKKDDETPDTVERDYYEYKYKYNNENFTLDKLVEAKLISSDTFINPKNKMQCFDNGEYPYPEIRVFKDSDFVTYYYVSLEKNNCDIDEGNWIITNIPKNLCDKVKSNEINCS